MNQLERDAFVSGCAERTFIPRPSTDKRMENAMTRVAELYEGVSPQKTVRPETRAVDVQATFLYSRNRYEAEIKAARILNRTEDARSQSADPGPKKKPPGFTGR